MPDLLFRADFRRSTEPDAVRPQNRETWDRAWTPVSCVCLGRRGISGILWLRITYSSGPLGQVRCRQSSDIGRRMTKLLEQGIEAVRALPADRQDMAGQLLLSIAKDDPRYRLTIEQIEDLKLSIAQADRGEFASDAEI